MSAGSCTFSMVADSARTSDEEALSATAIDRVRMWTVLPALLKLVPEITMDLPGWMSCPLDAATLKIAGLMHVGDHTASFTSSALPGSAPLPPNVVGRPSPRFVPGSVQFQ